jgi:hypothetical protein
MTNGLARIIVGHLDLVIGHYFHIAQLYLAAFPR